MADDILLLAAKVSKAYAVHRGRASRFAHLLLGMAPGEPFWAVQDVSISLRRGEALGVIGRNGAGKSTLLQVLCGIQEPTRGTVERRGRIAAMLELGAGFKPDFTGRENVDLCASIYGLNAAQISDRIDDIAAFAEIGEYFDRPVREYSSGMFARLAFAVCAHVDADILAVDEVLSVGDAAFQARCRRYIEAFLSRGAVIFVSHNDEAVVNVCSHVVWLDRGRVAAQGDPEEVVIGYRTAMTRENEDYEVPELELDVRSDDRRPATEGTDRRRGTNPIEVSSFVANAPAHGQGGVVIDDVHFSDPQGGQIDRMQGCDVVTLVIAGRAERDVHSPIVGFILRDGSGQNLFGDNTYLRYRANPQPIAGGERFEARLTFQMPYLPKGSYGIAPSVIEGTQDLHVHLHWIEDAVVLTVNESPLTAGRIGVSIVGRVESLGNHCWRENQGRASAGFVAATAELAGRRGT